jgi:hypothetical protein
MPQAPTNSLSALRLPTASPADNGVTVIWQSVSGVSYFLEASTNLSPRRRARSNSMATSHRLRGTLVHRPERKFRGSFRQSEMSRAQAHYL